jgi:PPK2 family polyphosphate:nucleotide phosphotransferase
MATLVISDCAARICINSVLVRVFLLLSTWQLWRLGGGGATMAAMSQSLTFEPGKKIRLADFVPDYVPKGLEKTKAVEETAANAAVMAELAYKLYAENRHALLIVLQGMDTSGKDSTIRNVLHGVNPQSCQVTPFKQPSAEELDHDFLWRIHKAVPARGNIGIFNRSQYEDVLVVRVHSLVPEKEWRTRYDRINEFEKLLTQGGVTIVKFFLHISKDEQRKQLQERIDDPNKRWKFRRGDLDERKLWDDYQQAYEEAMWQCNTKHAPWHIVPSDKKWYRNLAVSQVLLKTLKELDPKFPPAEEGIEGILVE